VSSPTGGNQGVRWTWLTSPERTDEAAAEDAERRQAPPAEGHGALGRVAPLVGDEAGVLAVLVLLVVAVSIHNQDFLRTGNLLETARQSAYVGILALGMVFRARDARGRPVVGGTYALTICASAILMRDGWNPWARGRPPASSRRALRRPQRHLRHRHTRVPSFIATLGTLSVYRGLALAISQGRQISGVAQDSSFVTSLGGNVAGVPAAVWVCGTATCSHRRLRPHSARRAGAAIGYEPDAAAFSGIPTDRVRIQC
jgi:ribose transport system permease protein